MADVKEQAQEPYKADFARLGRSVWFTLESSFRSDDQRAAALEKRLGQVGQQVQQTAMMGISWMKLGNWEKRNIWTVNEWVAFLRMWGNYSGVVFCKDVATEQEQNLVDVFSMYYNFYASVPERPTIAPEELTMEVAGQQVDTQLEAFQERLGDPLTPCAFCDKCALGYKLFRCSRCKRAHYCSRACQSKAWKRGHKRDCVPSEEEDEGSTTTS